MHGKMRRQSTTENATRRSTLAGPQRRKNMIVKQMMRLTSSLILVCIVRPYFDAEASKFRSTVKSSSQSSHPTRIFSSSFISLPRKTCFGTQIAIDRKKKSSSTFLINSAISCDPRSSVDVRGKLASSRSSNTNSRQANIKIPIRPLKYTELYSSNTRMDREEPSDTSQVVSRPDGSFLWKKIKKWNADYRKSGLSMTTSDEDEGESHSTSSNDSDDKTGDSNSSEKIKEVKIVSETSEASTSSNSTDITDKSIRTRLQRLKEKTRNIVARGSSLPAPPKVPPPLIIPMPQAIAAVIRDAAQLAVESAMEDVIVPAIQQRQQRKAAKKGSSVNGEDNIDIADIDLANVVKLTEAAVEDSIALQTRKAQLVAVEGLARELVEISQKALEQAQNSISLAEQSKDSAKQAQALAQEAANAAQVLQSTLANMVDEVSAQSLPAAVMNITTTASPGTEAAPAPPATRSAGPEVDFSLSEMAPPFIDETQCLVPGEAVIRIEKAPENSRRIFAGIDILGASVDDVWNVLTDYDNLQKVVPNLVTNRVLELYEGESEVAYEQHLNEVLNEAKWTPERQCQELATKQKGAKLFQVGGAKVVGINFSAKTTLDVREWPQGLPDFAHFGDEVYQNKSRDKRIEENSSQKLQRYNFPRPFALCTLPHKDISMQSVKNDDGEFRLYQGVWRMQPLPGCAPPGMEAMRLTYAVEISPRPYLPVRLVEGRIAQDLCNNLKAIRSYVSSSTTSSGKNSKRKTSASKADAVASTKSVTALRP